MNNEEPSKKCDQTKLNDSDIFKMRFELWKEYEGVAMHFNELIIKLRTQAIGGVAALSVVAGVIGNTSLDNRWEISIIGFIILILFWTAILSLDIFYYNRLLQGAVVALRNLEKKPLSLIKIPILVHQFPQSI